MDRYLFKTLYAVLATLLILVWLMQSSVNTYWQETYHREPLAPTLQDTQWGRLGTGIQQRWMAQLGGWTASLADFDKKSMAAINQIWFAQTASVVEPEPGPEAEPVFVPSPELVPAPETVAMPTEILLEKGDKVLFVGDSLMQGVAPHIRKVLFKEYGIEGIDLSKQSTGLAYTGFFNWPKTVADTFVKHPDLKLMVVFLGPNDPWDFPLKKGQPYVKFKSPEWEAAYRERIQAILNTARMHDAHVVWLEVPNMKKKKLNDGMTYLNTLYESEVLRSGGIFMLTNTVLGSDGLTFAAYAQVNDKKTKVRLDDGIHFTLPGQRVIADRVLTHIQAIAAQ